LPHALTPIEERERAAAMDAEFFTRPVRWSESASAYLKSAAIASDATHASSNEAKPRQRFHFEIIPNLALRDEAASLEIFNFIKPINH
jgi:hypothetical protein